jgi:hypothetical protein
LLEGRTPHDWVEKTHAEKESTLPLLRNLGAGFKQFLNILSAKPWFTR